MLRSIKIRSMKMIMVAGLLSLPGLSQTAGSASEKQSAPAQTVQSAPKKLYQLIFVVQELENERVINSRTYSIIMRGDRERGSIRAGEKVPFSSASGANTQWQQIDVGVNIDCEKLEEVDNGVSLYIKAEISSVMQNRAENSPPPSLPIIRNNQWESAVVLPIKQPTVVFSSDDTASKRKMQLEITVTHVR